MQLLGCLLGTAVAFTAFGSKFLQQLCLRIGWTSASDNFPLRITHFEWWWGKSCVMGRVAHKILLCLAPCRGLCFQSATSKPEVRFENFNFAVFANANAKQTCERTQNARRPPLLAMLPSDPIILRPSFTMKAQIYMCCVGRHKTLGGLLRC